MARSRIPNTKEERLTLWIGLGFMMMAIGALLIWPLDWWTALPCLLAFFLGGLFIGTAAEARANRIAAMRFTAAINASRKLRPLAPRPPLN